MANGSDKLLRELTTLSSNFDSLYQELKESTKANIESSESIKNLTSDIKKGSMPGGQDLEKAFKGFTESFAKTIASENDKLISDLKNSISKSLIESSSNFISNLPSQIAQVKAGQPIDFKSILGSGTVKNALSGVIPKIPGLKDGGTVEGDGIAVVGEGGPELVKLDKGNKVRTMEQQIMDMMLEEERERNVKLGRIVQQNPLQAALSKITTDSKLISEFIEYSQNDLDKSDQQELLADPDYLKDEFDYFLSERDREYFTQEDLQKLSPTSNPTKLETINDAAVLKNPTPSVPKVETIKDTEVLKTPTPVEPQQSEVTPKQDLVSDQSKLKSGISGINDVTSLVKSKIDDTKKKGSDAMSQVVNTAQELKERVTKPFNKESEGSGGSNANESSNALEKINQATATLKGSSSSPSSTPAKKSKESSTSSSPTSSDAMTSKDVKEMKSLLASIYQALRSPLTIVNDVPFRPTSNNF